MITRIRGEEVGLIDRLISGVERIFKVSVYISLDAGKINEANN